MVTMRKKINWGFTLAGVALLIVLSPEIFGYGNIDWRGLWTVTSIVLWMTFYFVMYVLPAYIAYKRKSRHFLAIAILDLALGWTGLGWLAALIWACA